jgi:deoxyribodipyrimidine photolyase
MIGVILVRENFRFHDNPLFFTLKKYRSIVFVYVMEENISSRVSHFKLAGFLEYMNAFRFFNVRGYLYNKSYTQLQSDLKKAILEDFEIVDDGGKIFLFPRLEREYKLFTPFFKYHLQNSAVDFFEKEVFSKKVAYDIKSLDFILIEDVDIIHNDYFMAGEKEALSRWNFFKKTYLPFYEEKRDFLDADYTAMLSPYINAGQLSIRLLWHETIKEVGVEKGLKFLSELAWRDFAYHIRERHPDMEWENMNKKILIEYEYNADYLESWKRGGTGYELVDAGMKQLKLVGWIPNRVRMVVASFLTKNLLIRWQEGAQYFLEMLIDGDPVVNAMNWQWVAGTGIDHAPYFRVFNPLLQANKYDPQEVYRKKWKDKNDHIKIINLADSRKKALKRYKKL